MVVYDGKLPDNFFGGEVCLQTEILKRGVVISQISVDDAEQHDWIFGQKHNEYLLIFCISGISITFFDGDDKLNFIWKGTSKLDFS